LRVGRNIGITIGPGADGALVTLSYIVCNIQHGVQITNSSSVSLTHNGIGIGYALDLGNGGAGVYAAGTAGTFVSSNLISGNGSAGILFLSSTQALVRGNYIGTDGAGTAAIPNGSNGVALTATSDHNTIGGANNADGNLISGNGDAGVLIDASHDNVVSRNAIGLNNPETGALPNGQDGVWINNGSTGNTVGSSDISQAQYIAGNAGSGVLIMNSNRNYVPVSNRIGVGPSGNALGNADVGVLVIDSASNTVDPTRVAYNGTAGVAAVGTTSIGNFLSPFHVYRNAGLPVDLQLDGPTPNDGDDDTGTGANNLLEYPVITASAGGVITGTVCANCTVYVYQAIGNPAAAGGGGDYLQAAFADGTGHWSTTLTGGMTRLSVTLQAYDNASNTSEFSPRPIVYLPLVRR
jgi:Right handed beta helix region